MSEVTNALLASLLAVVLFIIVPLLRNISAHLSKIEKSTDKTRHHVEQIKLGGQSAYREEEQSALAS
jgi:hypothetical protein